MGFSGSSDGKESGFDPWVGKIPWRKKWLLTPLFLPGEFHRQRSLVGYSSWGCKECHMYTYLIVYILSEVVLNHFSYVWLFVTLWTVVHNLGKNSGVGCHFLLQGSFPPRNRTQVSCIAGSSLLTELWGNPSYGNHSFLLLYSILLYLKLSSLFQSQFYLKFLLLLFSLINLA